VVVTSANKAKKKKKANADDDDDEFTAPVRGSSTTSVMGGSHGDASSTSVSRRALRAARGRRAVSDDKDETATKGLRHFSLKVCQKVEAKGITNYAEVADELVAEYKRETEKNGADISLVDQKNIRRRVYDALNVLRAMNVISKIKKSISWVGLPSAEPSADGHVQKGVTSIVAAAAAASSRHLAAAAAAAALAAHQGAGILAKRLAAARDTREAVSRRIAAKRAQCDELMAQQIWYRNLLSRNMRHADELLQPHVERVTLPFVVLNTRANTVIKCQVSPAQTEYFFSFSEPFEIYDDNEILKRMHQRLVLVSGTPQPPTTMVPPPLLPPPVSTFEQQLPLLAPPPPPPARAAPQRPVFPIAASTANVPRPPLASSSSGFTSISVAAAAALASTVAARGTGSAAVARQIVADDDDNDTADLLNLARAVSPGGAASPKRRRRTPKALHDE
jgi:hypothetical protein